LFVAKPGSMTRPRVPFLCYILWTWCLGQEARAHVISLPRDTCSHEYVSTTSENKVIETAWKLRVRTTTVDDIGPISGLLANSLVKPDDGSPKNVENQWKNWKVRMEVLRLQAGVERIIRSRFDAIVEAQKLLKATSSAGFPLPEHTESDRLRLMWSNGAVRHSILRAVRESPEPHLWNGHNLDVAPHDPCWLQHKMLTAEIAETGEICGFLEIAMLSPPALLEDEKCPLDALGAPTILNLVTSPNYRRRGIASRILQSASRFVRQAWSHEQQISLYVDKENQPALSMYKRVGFEMKGSVEMGDRHQWYMSRKLVRPSAMSRKPAMA
jgi:ribosomal protein S18 acetylase RimI-like enzyme